MTNYDVYFGTMERAMDSFSLFVDYHPFINKHPRSEVRAWQKEIIDMKPIKWLQAECTNKRWWEGVKDKR